MDKEAHFFLLTYQPTYFEKVVKEEHWVHAMNEEIKLLKEIKHDIL